MVRVAEGDTRAFRSLVEAHGPRVRGLALRQLRSAAEADDVAQEVFATVWSQAGRFDPARGAFRSWLWRLVATRCLDRQRWWRRWREVPTAERDRTLAALPSEAPDGARLAEARDRLAQAQAAIAALPSRQRLALLMTAVAGLTTADCAAALGTSTGSAEQLILRARRTLRQRAAAEGWDSAPGTERGP